MSVVRPTRTGRPAGSGGRQVASAKPVKTIRIGSTEIDTFEFPDQTPRYIVLGIPWERDAIVKDRWAVLPNHVYGSFTADFDTAYRHIKEIEDAEGHSALVLACVTGVWDDRMDDRGQVWANGAVLLVWQDAGLSPTGRSSEASGRYELWEAISRHFAEHAPELLEKRYGIKEIDQEVTPPHPSAGVGEGASESQADTRPVEGEG